MSQRRTELFLIDLVDAADEIASFASGIDREEFLADRQRRSAVFGQLVIVGQAAADIPHDMGVRHPEVEWSRVVGLRNE